MPALTKEDVKDWGLPRLRKEYGDALDRVQNIKDQNDGKLSELGGDVADEVKNLIDTTNLLGERIDELKGLDEADDQFAKHRERFENVEGFRFPGDDDGRRKDRKDGPRDVGGMLIESDAVEDGQLVKDRKVSVPLGAVFGGYKGIGEVPAHRKALFSSTDYPSPADFLAQPIEQLFQENNIGPLMPQFSTDDSTIRYPVETVTASGAATVAEGGTKPEADIDFSPTDETLETIAVLLPLTNKSLRNIAFLRAYVNGRLRLFVENEEDRQLLVGDGVGANLTGILNRSGIDATTSYSLGGANPDQALIDSIFSAAMRVRESKLSPDAFVTRPATWETARLAKDGNRNYLLGPPSEDAAVRVWGINGRLNDNMPAEAAGNTPVLVGAFAAAAAVLRRGNIELAATDSHSTHFAENKIMLRAEEEVGLAVFRPSGFAVVTSAT